MSKKIYFFALILVSCLTSNCYAFYCWPDFCHNKNYTLFCFVLRGQNGLRRIITSSLQDNDVKSNSLTTELTNSGQECYITTIQNGKDCRMGRFENLGYVSPTGDSLGKFRLSSYILEVPDASRRVTTFNLSISDIKFTTLRTRYQEIGIDTHSYCRDVDIYNNDGAAFFPDISISCRFTIDPIESHPYQLEYLVKGQNCKYSRKLSFNVPPRHSIDQTTNDVTTFLPFLYVDVSNIGIGKLILYIQALPEKYNVTQYKVWLINNETNDVKSLVLDLKNEPEIQHNFLVDEAVYYFTVAAIHPDCGKNGCRNSTSPMISTKTPQRRLLIMIISVVWVPPVILYAMFRGYKLYLKHIRRDRGPRRINCLLVYSPTHRAHVDVMKKLALYLRSCNINAMIDMLSIPETVNKDPGLWCNSAFQSADVIVVATSPPPTDVIVPVIYQNMDNHALRLLKENYSRRNKRYFALQFPYCERDDLPEEARLFRRFEMPQELDSFVRNIYHVDRIRLFGVSSKEFLQSIKIAVDEIPQEKISDPKIVDKTGNTVEPQFSDELFPSPIKQNTNKFDENKSSELKNDPEAHAVREFFTTNIDELNLLGENEESEIFIYKPQEDDNGFRIDRLNL